ncbi:hypothetical protein AB0L86_04910 [Micromonospora musae]|uniref:hypothetical protein n=1 Tax=Micromonospora musae TaxID=1894970 RepID=UPI00343456A5
MPAPRRPAPREPLPVRPIKVGDVLHLTRAASPQFVTPITVRVVRELTDRYPPYGWTWIDCYQLDARGDAVDKRELFVMREGLQWLVPRPAAPARRAPVRPARVRPGAPLAQPAPRTP